MLTQAPILKPDAALADLTKLLSGKVVGQSQAMNAIVPYVYMYQSGLAPEGRPAAVFLLLGPTGTGKTKTVEAIAELLHGSEKKLLKIDCGEFQMDHETANSSAPRPDTLDIVKQFLCLLSNSSLTQPAKVAIWPWFSLTKSRRPLLQLPAFCWAFSTRGFCDWATTA